MKASELADISRRAEARRESAARRKRATEVEETAQKAKKQARAILPQLRKDLLKAAKQGHSSHSISEQCNDLGRQTLWIVQEALEKDGYACSIEEKDTDYGDSAAPCHVYSYDLIIEWRK